MDPFYSYVAIGTLVLLIAILVVIGVMMSKMKSADVYPPMQNACPDYWDVSGNTGYCGFPASGGKNRGTVTADSADANKISATQAWAPKLGLTDGKWLKLGDSANWSKVYSGLSEICAKKRWAENNGIVWDGITNYNAC